MIFAAPSNFGTGISHISPSAILDDNQENTDTSSLQVDETPQKLK
jgi:hypothetical protein